MDDLLREFLTETSESLDVVDVELVKFEADPNNLKVLDNVFRLVHTIKGTCGFLGLPRLEALAHAAETLMGKFRDGTAVTNDAVSLVLSTIDRIKEILAALEADQAEPAGDDQDLIADLEKMSIAASRAPARAAESAEQPGRAPESAASFRRPWSVRSASGKSRWTSSRRRSARRRPKRPSSPSPPARAASQVRRRRPQAPNRRAPRMPGSAKTTRLEGGVAAQSIRVNVDTLETLMTMVSELVLTRNQLLEIVRRHEDSEFKVPLQRLSNVTAELQEGVMKTRMQPIGNAWQKLPRIVRDLSNELGKSIELEMHGAETELDRQVLDLIKDPLTHMVRNSADHGLESSDGPAPRWKAGEGHDQALRLSRGRPHHHRGRR